MKPPDFLFQGLVAGPPKRKIRNPALDVLFLGSLAAHKENEKSSPGVSYFQGCWLNRPKGKQQIQPWIYAFLLGGSGPSPGRAGQKQGESAILLKVAIRNAGYPEPGGCR